MQILYIQIFPNISFYCQNNTVAAQEILDDMIDNCGLEMPQSEEFYVPNEALQKIDFHKIHVNIKHIKCVAVAIGTAVADSDLAIEWIGYSLELKNSIARMVACGKHNSVQQKVYVRIY